MEVVVWDFGRDFGADFDPFLGFITLFASLSTTLSAPIVNDKEGVCLFSNSGSS